MTNTMIDIYYEYDIRQILYKLFTLMNATYYDIY